MGRRHINPNQIKLTLCCSGPRLAAEGAPAPSEQPARQKVPARASGNRLVQRGATGAEKSSLRANQPPPRASQPPPRANQPPLRANHPPPPPERRGSHLSHPCVAAAAAATADLQGEREETGLSGAAHNSASRVKDDEQLYAYR
jgi:hypothetical protein